MSTRSRAHPWFRQGERVDLPWEHGEELFGPSYWNDLAQSCALYWDSIALEAIRSQMFNVLEYDAMLGRATLEYRITRRL